MASLAGNLQTHSIDSYFFLSITAILKLSKIHLQFCFIDIFYFLFETKTLKLLAYVVLSWRYRYKSSTRTLKPKHIKAKNELISKNKIIKFIYM